MTLLLAAPSPRIFGLHDYRRSYVLPSEVNTNIPRAGGADEFGSWNYVRSVLVEVSRRLRAAPLSLHYRELEAPNRLPMGVEVTAVVDDTRRRLSVVSRRETAPAARVVTTGSSQSTMPCLTPIATAMRSRCRGWSTARCSRRADRQRAQRVWCDGFRVVGPYAPIQEGRHYE